MHNDEIFDVSVMHNLKTSHFPPTHKQTFLLDVFSSRLDLTDYCRLSLNLLVLHNTHQSKIISLTVLTNHDN